MKIGEVTKGKDNRYTGWFQTLSMRNRLNLEFVPVGKKESEGHPDFRILCRTLEIGGVWQRVGKESKKPYLSCKIDTPETGVIYFNTGKETGQTDASVLALFANAARPGQ